MNRGNKTNQSTENQVAKEINLKELFAVIKKRFWVAAVITVLFTLVAGVYSTFSTNLLYQTSSRIIIKAGAEDRTTLQVIMKDPTIMGKVVQELKLERSPEVLAGQITVQSIDTSQVVSISVIDSDPTVAASIANTTAKVFKEEIPNIIGFNDVQLLSDAKVVPFPINDNGNRMVMIGFVLGIVAGIGLVFLLESLDDSVKSEEDVEEFLGIPVLGKVPKMVRKNLKKKESGKTGIRKYGVKPLAKSKLFNRSKKRNLIAHSFPESKISEEFRTIRTNVRFVMNEQKHKIVLITSPNTGEGKSTTAANLAVSMSQQNEKVLLIDANLRKPSTHFIFNVTNSVGLTDVLTGKTTLNEAVIDSEIGSLEVLPSGKLPNNPAELLSSPMMKELLQEAAKEYDSVIIDSSSVLEVTDTKILASLCDGVLLVLYKGNTQLEKAAEAKKVLEFSKAKISGVILNEM